MIDGAAVQMRAAAEEDGASMPAALLTESEFRELYLRYARPLWAYLFRLTGSGADADDLVQDAFCRLLATPMATREDAELKAYLFRIASNAAIDAWRRKGRRPREAALEAPVPDQGDLAADLAQRRDIGRTFRDLKTQERVLLWLAHVEGSAHREIAQVLGLKPASVPVLLMRARRKLADLLRRKGLAPGDR